MATTPEGKVKDWTDRQVLKLFPDRFKFMPVPNRFGGKGIPDILYCIRGRFIAVEVKSKSGMQPTAIQLKKMSEISESGGLAICMDGKNLDVIQQIRAYVNEVL